MAGGMPASLRPLTKPLRRSIVAVGSYSGDLKPCGSGCCSGGRNPLDLWEAPPCHRSTAQPLGLETPSFHLLTPHATRMHAHIS